MSAEGGIAQWTKMLAEGKDGTTAAPSRMEKPMRHGDILLVVDMQNDLLPGGALEVYESQECCRNVVSLVERASAVGTRVIATRAYHPIDHCSFVSRKGPFPPHCVQGTDGALICNDVKEALVVAREKSTTRDEQSVHVCFKGFVEDTASYGALPYDGAYATGRLPVPPDKQSVSVDRGLEWTGAFELRCSAAEEDLNAPPDLRAVLRRKPVRELLWGVGDRARLFVCGLPYDFGVLDTACCAAMHGICPLEGVWIIHDATRPLYAPGVGKFGGFISSPREVGRRLTDHSVKLCLTADALGA